MIDRAMAYELVCEWLPDFIAYQERTAHPLALDLLMQARNRVWDDYDANTTYDAAKEQIDYAASDVTTILEGVAEWIVAARDLDRCGEPSHELG